jgi:hypothetical protein
MKGLLDVTRIAAGTAEVFSRGYFAIRRLAGQLSSERNLQRSSSFCRFRRSASMRYGQNFWSGHSGGYLRGINAGFRLKGLVS